jgi:FtsP/CotA-like multicopper oxidase with cupredoxin domain
VVITRKYLLHGANFQVTSIDGIPIENPEQLPTATSVQIAAGGRYDLTFTMPKHVVHFSMITSDNEPGQKPPEIVFVSTPNQKGPIVKNERKQFDPTQYGNRIKNGLL